VELGSGDCRKTLVHHGVVTAGSELANDRGDGSGSAVDYDGVLLVRSELRNGRWVDADPGARGQRHRLGEGKCTALEVVPAERGGGRGDALEKNRCGPPGGAAEELREVRRKYFVAGEAVAE
jgi:hypothetical protein